MLVSLIVSELF